MLDSTLHPSNPKSLSPFTSSHAQPTRRQNQAFSLQHYTSDVMTFLIPSPQLSTVSDGYTSMLLLRANHWISNTALTFLLRVANDRPGEALLSPRLRLLGSSLDLWANYERAMEIDAEFLERAQTRCREQWYEESLTSTKLRNYAVRLKTRHSSAKNFVRHSSVQHFLRHSSIPNVRAELIVGLDFIVRNRGRRYPSPFCLGTQLSIKTLLCKVLGIKINDPFAFIYFSRVNCGRNGFGVEALSTESELGGGGVKCRRGMVGSCQQMLTPADGRWRYSQSFILPAGTKSVSKVTSFLAPPS
ncbi:hypothetical protein T439DRAFT_226854 [Meredithblackwellia eburnea MCA 4105]